MKAFLRYYVELPFPVGEVDRVIGQLPAEWLDRAAQEASVRAVLLLGSRTADEAELGAGGVCVSLSSPKLVDRVLCRAIQWLATGRDEPLLHGDLELAELGASRTQLALSAQHRPFARVDQSTNRAASQRIAESTLKAFVDRLASYVEEVLGSRSPAFLRGKLSLIEPPGSVPHRGVATR